MFAAFAPIWILTSVGYAIRRFGLIDASGAVAIARYVFYLAMPATLFLTAVANADGADRTYAMFLPPARLRSWAPPGSSPAGG